MKNIEFVTALRTIKMLCGVAVLFMMGCQYSSPRHSSSHQSSGDTTYTEAKAMSFHLNNPERAFVMIDSAVIVGNISWERGEYLKAITQYGGLHNIALSRQTCLNLIKSAPTDSSNLENVYTLLVAIENTSSNYPAVIRYATEA